MKKLLIVKAGDTFPAIARRHGDFETWIQSRVARPGLVTEMFDPRKAEKLEFPLKDISGAIVTGSHSMVTDRLPWSEATAIWLRKLVMHGIPLLGICYGHQLLAHAMGGEVAYHQYGIEVGTVAIHPAGSHRNDELFHDLYVGTPVQTIHRQSVRHLPPDALLLAGNAFEPHHAFRIGRCAWGVQFHPEFSADVMKEYIRHQETDLASLGKDALSLVAEVRGTDWAELVLQRFASVVERHETGFPKAA